MKRWLAFDGHVDAVANAVVVPKYQVWNTIDSTIYGLFDTLEQAQAAKQQLIDDGIVPGFLSNAIRISRIDNTDPVKIGQFAVSLTPVVYFDRQATLLTTRGFWDTTLRLPTATPATVATFSLGITLVPRKILYEITDSTDEMDEVIVQRTKPPIPNVLTDDVGWHVYESFARIVQGTINHDPPFHSKSKRIIKPGDTLLAVIGFAITDAVNTVSLTFGVRFRCLVDF